MSCQDSVDCWFGRRAPIQALPRFPYQAHGFFVCQLVESVYVRGSMSARGVFEAEHTHNVIKGTNNYANSDTHTHKPANNHTQARKANHRESFRITRNHTPLSHTIRHNLGHTITITAAQNHPHNHTSTIIHNFTLVTRTHTQRSRMRQ